MEQPFRSRNMMYPFGHIRVSVAAAVLGGALTLAALPGHAAEPKVLGAHKDWNAFLFEENGGKVCYVTSQPKKSESGGKPRGNVYVLITHRPAEKSLDVVSIMAGYTYKAGSEVAVTIGKDAFKLFTEGDNAWARNDKDDKALVAAMRSGVSMVVKGTSAKGTQTTDTYSLAGIGQAYAAINEACGLKR